MSERLHVVAGSSGRAPEPVGGAGLAGWLLGAMRQWREGACGERRKHMRVVETLTLGARNKLLLVSCGGERFLVGTGAESIGTIVRVRGEAGSLTAVREQV